MRFEATIPSTAICIGFTIWNFLRAFDHKKRRKKMVVGGIYLLGANSI